MDLKKIGRRKVLALPRETSVEEAARAMREAHLGDVIVIDGQRTPVGVLTDRDIVMATLALGADPSALLVDDIMSAGVISVPENESLGRVITLMKEHGVKRIPLVNATFELTGIVALEDIMTLLSSELSALAEVSARQRQFEVQRRRKIA